MLNGQPDSLAGADVLNSSNSFSKESLKLVNRPTTPRSNASPGASADNNGNRASAKNSPKTLNGRLPARDPQKGALESPPESQQEAILNLSFQNQKRHSWMFAGDATSPFSVNLTPIPPTFQLTDSEVSQHKYSLEMSSNPDLSIGPFQAHAPPRPPQINPFYAHKIVRKRSIEWLHPRKESDGLLVKDSLGPVEVPDQCNEDKLLREAEVQLGLRALENTASIDPTPAILGAKRVKPNVNKQFQSQLPMQPHPLVRPAPFPEQPLLPLPTQAPSVAKSSLSGHSPFSSPASCNPNIPESNPNLESPVKRFSKESLNENTNRLSSRFQTPERSSRLNRIGDVSVDRIIQPRFSEDNLQANWRMNAALNVNHFGAHSPTLSGSARPLPSVRPNPRSNGSPRSRKAGFHRSPNECLSDFQGPDRFLTTLGSFSKLSSPFQPKHQMPKQDSMPPRPSTAGREAPPICELPRLQLIEDLEQCLHTVHQSLVFKAPSPPDYLLSRNASIAHSEFNFVPNREQLVHLSNGDFGVVYRFQNPCDRQDYVLKMLHLNPQAAVREAQLLGYIRTRCPSRFIVGFHYSWVEDDSVNLLFESCRGRVDEHWRDNLPQLTERDLATVLLHVAKALKTLHRAHVVHLDIKPSNILVAEDGTYKLSDFGNSRLLTSQDDIDSMDEGDFAYTPKEFTGDVSWEDVVSGAFQLPKVDVFSLGVSVLELALAMEGVAFSKDVADHLRNGNFEALTSLTRISERFKSLLLKMLSGAQRDRPSAAEIVAEIRSLAHES